MKIGEHEYAGVIVAPAKMDGHTGAVPVTYHETVAAALLDAERRMEASPQSPLVVYYAAAVVSANVHVQVVDRLAMAKGS